MSAAATTELKQLYVLQQNQEAALNVTRRLIADKEKVVKKLPSAADVKGQKLLDRRNSKFLKYKKTA